MSKLSMIERIRARFSREKNPVVHVEPAPGDTEPDSLLFDLAVKHNAEGRIMTPSQTTVRRIYY